MQLDNLVTLITGGSRGIGRCLAEHLAAKKMRVIVTASTPVNLESVLASIREKGGIAEGLACDLADPQQVVHLAHQAAAIFGQLDVLINNAGTSLNKSSFETTNEEWAYCFAVNATAPFILCRECLPYLKQSKAPSILNIGSVVGLKGYVNQAAYGASKHALMGFTKVLAQEVQPFGIRVHSINPGAVYSEMVRIMRPDLDPDGLIRPEEIAELITFILEHRGNAVIDDLHIRRANGTPWY